MTFNEWWDSEGLELYKQGVQDHYLFASYAWDAAIESAEKARADVSKNLIETLDD